MLGNFSFNDAYRVIKNVVDERINMLIRSGAGVEVTWGTVASIDSSSTCSVYLFGESAPSTGFRFENGVKPNVLDPVRVSIDKRGNRWVDAVLGDSTLAYPKLEIDVRAGEIRAGDGTVAPVDVTVHDHDTEYDASGAASSAVASHAAADDPHPTYYKSGEAISVPTATITSPGSRITGPSGYSIPSGGTTLGSIEVYNPSTTTGDAYITFHNPNRYAAHFGLDGATSDLFYGGYSAGTKKKVWHAGNSTPPYQIRSGTATVVVNAGTNSGSVAVTWAAMTNVPDIVLVVQTTMPGGSGNFIVKTTSASWSTTGATLYANIATAPGANVSCGLHYVALSF